ncbi:MAG TPA: transketolase C-terminal domain-containing protein [Kofleriaceae bacterium]
MKRIQFIRRPEFERVWGLDTLLDTRLSIVADMCRANALAAIKRAGSGHVGSSFSAMDLVVWLYYHELDIRRTGVASPDRDIYFSSKGHDVPGLYAVLYSLGIVDESRFLKLRRYGGLDGHPDVGVAGIEANSGSLGMGISKAKGIAWAKRFLGRRGRVVVLLGDGELQEGQIYEGLQTAAHQNIKLTAIIDHNKVQSDKPVDEITRLGDLNAKLSAFGWKVARTDGHDFASISAAFRDVADHEGPSVIIADTIKGRGVSFMEHPEALRSNHGKYRWHAGAPDDASYTAAYAEIRERIDARLLTIGTGTIESHDALEDGSLVSTLAGDVALGEDGVAPRLTSVAEYTAQGYGDALIELADECPELVVLDGDLAIDCRVRRFEELLPARFIEDGISEQDMVSMAGGLARHGLIPVVNSFASFLTSRANEQIYNNATERTKIIYACHYAGLIPAGPGKSHQSIRDVSLLAALPNMIVIQPASSREARLALRWAVLESRDNCALRLVIGPSPRTIDTPATFKFELGRGYTVLEGSDHVLFAYGPVMLNEALLAAERLAARGISLRVVNCPWLNRTDVRWLDESIANVGKIFVVEDHAPIGALGDQLRRSLGRREIRVFGVEGFPACGNPAEALKVHGLDGASLAARIEEDVRT